MREIVLSKLPFFVIVEAFRRKFDVQIALIEIPLTPTYKHRILHRRHRKAVLTAA